MIRTTTLEALGTTTAPSASQRLAGARRQVSRTIARAVRHLRVRVSRRRPATVLSIVLAGASALTCAAAAGTVVTYRIHYMNLHSSVEPLAPAPAPPAPPKFFAAPHRIVANLGKINPLRGLASWYGDVWNGRKTASGETFDETKLTAAHKTLPLGTIVRVTNLDSQQSVVVRINDRGTLAPHRIIDLSSAAARELGMINDGLAHVKLEILGKI